jgi:hypothetical protein
MGAVTIPAWAAMVLASIITGLIALVWHDLVKRIDVISSKLEGHVTGDTLEHGRITSLETTIDMHSQSIKDNADRLHRFMAESRESTSKLHMWITEKVIESIKRQ